MIENRDEWLSLRLSDYEKDILETLAKLNHRNKSEMTRELIRNAGKELGIPENKYIAKDVMDSLMNE